MRKTHPVTVTTTGTPPLAGADAFARMLVAAQEKRPDLRVVSVNEAQETQWKTTTKTKSSRA